MSYDQFEGISTRWDELDFDIQNSVDFKNGFVFGKIEHKFTSWFYSENGRSMTDDEYKEFWKVLADYAKKL